MGGPNQNLRFNGEPDPGQQPRATAIGNLSSESPAPDAGVSTQTTGYVKMNLYDQRGVGTITATLDGVTKTLTSGYQTWTGLAVGSYTVTYHNTGSEMEYFSSGDINYTGSPASSFTGTLPYNETFDFPDSSFSFTINDLDVSIAIVIPS